MNPMFHDANLAMLLRINRQRADFISTTMGLFKCAIGFLFRFMDIGERACTKTKLL